MKILFVDDEPLIRKGQQILIPWEDYGFDQFLEAEDGESAIELINKENPELVLLDIRMDNTDGLVVSKSVRENGYKGRIIIISGYSEFSYAKSAINSEVTAYLLKPVDPDELSRAVKKALDELEKENLINVYSGQSYGQAQQAVLSNLLTGKLIYNKDIEDIYHFGLHKGFIRLSAIFAYKGTLNREKKLDSLLRGEKDKNVCLIMENSTVFILHTSMQQCKEFENQIESLLTDPLNNNLFVIIGKPFYNVVLLGEEYLKVKKVIEHIFYHATSVHICNVPMNEKNVDVPDIINEINVVVNGIINGNKDIVNDYLVRLREYLYFRKCDVPVLGFIIGNIYQQIRDKLCTHYPELQISMMSHINFSGELGKCNFFYEYMNLFEQQIFICIEEVEKNCRMYPCNRICKYIEENYASSIKLEEIAKQMGYNSVYLGRLFRSEVGMSFNLYLDKVRLEQAKCLLKQKISVAMTAEKIGYNDIDYFTKKFKKYTGCLPSHYQKNK